MDKFNASLTESLTIGAVAAVGSLVGADAMINRTIAPVTGGLGGTAQNALLVFTIVFTADMVYNMFLA